MVLRGRSRWLLGLLVALALVAAACNGDEEEVTPSPSPEETAEETPTEEEPTIPEFTTLEEGVLKVGSDIPYPPFEFREAGELVGLDIDLINEIASRLGLTTDIVDTDFDTIFTQLATGRFDVVIAASTITPEREEEVNFADPYYASQQSLTINSEERPDITGTADLGEGDVVAVQRGTTGKKWSEENLVPQGVELRSFPEGPDLYTALEAGQVDGAINDEPSAIAEVAARTGLEIVATIDTGEFYGIAVDPNNPGLLEAVNFVLAEIIADGTYDGIYAAYPDLPPGGNIAAL